MAIQEVFPNTGLVNAYAAKANSYFAGARADFVAALPEDGTAAVLEIGCGTGATGSLALKGGRCRRYVGVELMESAAAQARQILTEVHVGDVETITLPWTEPTFDALFLSEVLEHLVDPWAVLERLAPLMKPGALVMASSPNVAHWRVIAELLKGRFTLADQGVFDRTHMRWFTPTTFAEMFDRAGFDVDQVGPVTGFSQRTRLISGLSGGRLDHLFMTQVFLRGRRR